MPTLPKTISPSPAGAVPRADIALALGGGGVRGAAHFVVLEAIDDLGLKVGSITGTSIGAIIGALYASGMNGSAIREHLISMAGRPGVLIRNLVAGRVIALAGLMRMTHTGWSLVDGRRALERFLPAGLPARLEDLGLPLRVVATDLARARSVAFDEGALLPILAASSAIPGLMRPVRLAGTIFTDGAVLNPLPVNQVVATELPVVAVDLGTVDHPSPDARVLPDAITTATLAVQMQARAITLGHLAKHPPAVLLQPEVGAFRPPDFHRARELIEHLEGFRDTAKRQIEAGLEKAQRAG